VGVFALMFWCFFQDWRRLEGGRGWKWRQQFGFHRKTPTLQGHSGTSLSSIYIHIKAGCKLGDCLLWSFF
jgi:hypothetical protein